MIATIADALSALGIEHRTMESGSVLARIEGSRGNAERCVVLMATSALLATIITLSPTASVFTSVTSV